MTYNLLIDAAAPIGNVARTLAGLVDVEATLQPAGYWSFRFGDTNVYVDDAHLFDEGDLALSTYRFVAELDAREDPTGETGRRAGQRLFDAAAADTGYRLVLMENLDFVLMRRDERQPA